MVDSPTERSRGDTPVRLSEHELETLKSERAVPRADLALWPTTRRGAVLSALAVLAAIMIGVIPALWINRWRAGAATPPPRVQAQPRAAEVERASAQPAEPVEVAPPEPAAPAAAAAESAPAPAAASPPARTIRPTRSRPERARPTPRARKPPPPCDVYLHPKGCPN